VQYLDPIGKRRVNGDGVIIRERGGIERLGAILI
jgi:hypothetical protein